MHPYVKAYLTGDLGSAGALTDGAARPGAIRPPPGPISSRFSPVGAGPGATGTLPAPIPPRPKAGTSALGAIGLVGPRVIGLGGAGVWAIGAVAKPSNRATTAVTSEIG